MNLFQLNYSSNFINELIKSCRKGNLVWVTCATKKLRTEISKELKSAKIVNKRGVYMWKGIIILSTKNPGYMKGYIDILYEVS